MQDSELVTTDIRGFVPVRGARNDKRREAGVAAKVSARQRAMKGAKRLECAQLAAAFEPSDTLQSGGKPRALQTLREIRWPKAALSKRALQALVCGLTFSAWAAGAGVLKIELPPETLAFKPGPGAELANGQCLVCHSVDYVVMQPPMPRPFWVAEVKKMREKFGAALPEDQVETVANYLTQTYGVDTNVVAGAAQAAGTPGNAVAPVAASSGEALATRYGCLGCHNVTTKIVGPAYRDVAKKYQGDPKAFSQIAEQIHQGGSGKWGPTIMPPFPMMSDAEVKTLAEWILSRR